MSGVVENKKSKSEANKKGSSKMEETSKQVNKAPVTPVIPKAPKAPKAPEIIELVGPKVMPVKSVKATTYPWEKLEVGGVPFRIKGRKTPIQVSTANKKYAPKKFACRVLEDGSYVWRVQ